MVKNIRTFCISPLVSDSLDELAKQSGASKSSLVENAIKDFVQKARSNGGMVGKMGGAMQDAITP